MSGARNVVTARLGRGVDRLIHLSSIQAFEENHPDIRSGETDYRASPHGYLPYNHSKAVGEMEVRRGIAEGLNAVILKPTGIIGPYDFKPSYLGRAILTLAHGEIPALVEGGFDWIDVRDVVAVMIGVQQKAPSGSSYILSGHWRSVRAIAAQVAELTGAVAPRITVPLWTAYLGLPLMRLHARIHKREPLYTRASLDLLGSNRPLTNDLARQALDFTPRPFDETIAAAVQWFAENGYLRFPMQHPNKTI